MKILLADDNAVSRKLLQKILERSGFEVVSVDNGQNAMDCLLAPGGPRLAILDWVMPVKDGPCVCREIRASTAIPYVYLILLTSRESPQDVVAGLEAGADDYLTKPCHPQEMRARVRTGQRILELQDKLIYDAHHDSLTGLPNRAFFVERLAESVKKANRRSNYRFAVLFVDIDRFKLINDSFGHQSGDKLMIGAAERLLQAVRTESRLFRLPTSRSSDENPFDIVARIGGDEFVVLLDDIGEIGDGIRVARRIQSALESAFVINNTEVVVTASIGISMNDPDTNASDMLERADAAMYDAKVLGKARYEVSGPTASSGGARLFKLEKELRSAVENKEFVVHYQPIIALEDSRIRGFEALIRWRHPERGLVRPREFVSVAEDTGLIVPIGAWVLHEACRQMNQWNTKFASQDPMTVCVNVSPKQVAPRSLVRCVKEALESSGLQATSLELEVTENLPSKEAERAAKILRDLGDLGVSLSLDDFGTGYSSLSYLHKLPIRTLKIDRSFISEIEERRENHGVVQTIVALGHNLGMKVVAEGVENEEQFRMLKRMKCDLAQGYLFSRPIDAESVDAMLLAGRKGEVLGPGGTIAA